MATFFVNADAMEILATMETNLTSLEKQNMVIEFVDAAPLTAEISYEGDDTDITVYQRDEMHTNMTINCHGVAHNGDVSVDDGDEETVEIAFRVAESINQYLLENNACQKFIETSAENSGIFFEADLMGKLAHIFVTGKERPDLLCTTLFGGMQMTRPYMDELEDAFDMETMSLEELEEAANDGDPSAMERLAMAYLNGDYEVDEDSEKSYYWLVKLAETGDNQAMFNVGLFTAKGFGTERDFAKAAEWMQKAADEGDEDAETCVVEYRKLAEAVEKANAGDAQAQADLASGLMKLGGSLEQAGEGKDYVESVMWAEKAVTQGNPDGYWVLALAYHHGRGVDENMDKAIELYQKGADAGSTACLHNLGCEYMSGENVERDTHKGFNLIKLAAEQGYGLAMRDLGRCYQFATGTEGNMKTAIEWYEKALEVIEDPELAEKVAVFKELEKGDPSFGESYPEEIMTCNEDKEEINVSSYKYDNLLRFDWSRDVWIIKDVNDEGNPTFGIGIGKTLGDDGDTNYEYRMNILCNDRDEDSKLNLDPSAIKLDGNIEGYAQFIRNTTSFLGSVKIVNIVIIWLIHKEKVYGLTSFKIGETERREKWIQFINDVLSGVILDGQKGGFAPITEDMFDKTLYPVAIPAENQHSHWDFLEKTRTCLGLLGGLAQVNQNGTEYSFQALDEEYWEHFEDEDILIAITKVAEEFPMAKTAREMGEIFRVSESAFDDSEDRESEIANGLLRRCGMYEAFRSFAWTLAAYCDKEGRTLEQVTIDDVTDIVEFVNEQCGRLNYEANSFCPVLCSGDDIHNYYIPDVTPEEARNALIENMSKGLENKNFTPRTHILSLDGLRKDMEYLFPVMKTIYDNLAAERNFDEPLEGAVADILYVWCSMTYALRTPVYTEDGPINCFWNYPGKESTLKSFRKLFGIEDESFSDDISIAEHQDDELLKEETNNYFAKNNKKELMQHRLQQLSEQRNQYAVMRRDSEVENYIKQLRNRAEKNYKKLNNALKNREEIMSQQSFESIVDPKLLRHFSLMEEDVQEYGNTIGLMASEVMGKFMDVYEETSPSILLDMISTIEEAIDDVNDFRVDFTDIGGYLEYEWPETCDYYFLKQNLQNMKQNLENAKKQQNWTSAMEEEYARLEYALRYEIDEEDVENHKKYLNGCERMKSAKTEAEYKEAAQIFKQILGYLDADELKEKCELARKRAKELESAQKKHSDAQKKMENLRKKYEELLRQTMEQEQTCHRLAEEVAKKSEAYPEDRQRLEEKCSLEIVGVNEKIRVSNEKIECLNREIAQANEELNRLSFFAMGKKKELQSIIATLNMQSDNEKHQVDELKKEEEDLNIKRDSMLKQLDHEVEYAQRELETANDLYVELKRKLEKSEAELTEAGKQYEMAKKELEML